MVLYKEQHGNSSTPIIYSPGPEGSPLVRVSTNSRVGIGLMGFLRQVFLPEGYPDSVSKDYMEYQVWDTLQAFASSISGSLATAAVLQGVGVGDSTATPLAATLTWILKDGAGMIGRIGFAAYVGTSLDFDCKRWRMFADITNDTVMFVELLAPALPKPLVLPTLCLAGVGRSLVGVAGGATKAAVAQHQALRRNMADLSAKDGSQETLVNLVALCVNLVVLPMVTGDTWLTGGLFLLLTILHIYCNYKAVSCLVMSTMNTARIGEVLNYWRQEGEVLTVIQGNRRESVLWPGGGEGVVLGISMGELATQEVSLLESAISKEHKYVVLPSNHGKTRVLLSNKAETRDVYRAYIHALLGEDKPELLTQLEDKGWRLDILALETQGYTYCLPV